MIDANFKQLEFPNTSLVICEQLLTNAIFFAEDEDNATMNNGLINERRERLETNIYAILRYRISAVKVSS